MLKPAETFRMRLYSKRTFSTPHQVQPPSWFRGVRTIASGAGMTVNINAPTVPMTELAGYAGLFVNAFLADPQLRLALGLLMSGISVIGWSVDEILMGVGTSWLGWHAVFALFGGVAPLLALLAQARRQVHAVHAELREAGLPVALAGSGPSLLVVAPRPEAATRAEQVRRICRARNAGWRVFVSEWEPEGATAT